MAVVVSPTVYPNGQTFIGAGQTAVINATTDQDKTLTVTISDGVSTGTGPVVVQAAMSASAPAGSNVTITQPSHGVFNVKA